MLGMRDLVDALNPDDSSKKKNKIPKAVVNVRLRLLAWFSSFILLTHKIYFLYVGGDILR